MLYRCTAICRCAFVLVLVNIILNGVGGCGWRMGGRSEDPINWWWRVTGLEATPIVKQLSVARTV